MRFEHSCVCTHKKKVLKLINSLFTTEIIVGRMFYLKMCIHKFSF